MNIELTFENFCQGKKPKLVGGLWAALDGSDDDDDDSDE